jgi:hypothetical protein
MQPILRSQRQLAFRLSRHRVRQLRTSQFFGPAFASRPGITTASAAAAGFSQFFGPAARKRVALFASRSRRRTGLGTPAFPLTAAA